jgi:hypothetical protein
MVMKKLSTGLLLLLALLTGCGGGGSAQPEPESKPIIPKPISQFETPATISVDKFRLAKIDYRYDTPKNQFDINGYHTTSFESVKPVVDKIKQIGFTGIILLLQTPINKHTGRISLTDVENTDKTIPKDTWKLVEYAKSQGLQVWLSLQIVDSVTDVLLTPNFNKYTEQSMFNNIIEYQRKIAITAEQYKIQGIFISEGNYNLESYEHLFYWQQLISEIRKVYSGKLSYATYLMMPTSIWNHVDYASINLNEVLSKTPIYDLKTIINLYSNDSLNRNQIQLIKNFHMVYGKKLILMTTPTVTDMGVGHIPSTFWENVINNVWTNVFTPQTDKQMQLLKIRAFMEVVNKHLADVTDGVGFGEFDPWLQHVNFSKHGTGIYHYYCCGFDLTNNTDAQKTINLYFSKQWGYYSIQ